MIVLRSCEGLDEFEACVQLQIETWGADPTFTVPRKLFLIAQRIGGQAIGAFDTDLPNAKPEGNADSLVGFALSSPGIKNRCGKPQPYLHSIMLAVRATHRNRGIGAQLKLKQRDEALSRGITLMEWTFDPLEIKNAFLNIHKLGAVVCGYHVEFYGLSSSRLEGGLPTDRLIAEWYMDSARVCEKAEGNVHRAGSIEVEERIVVPAAIQQWKSSSEGREQAIALQFENRQKFQEAFKKGLAVLDFRCDVEGNGIFELGFPG